MSKRANRMGAEVMVAGLWNSAMIGRAGRCDAANSVEKCGLIRGWYCSWGTYYRSCHHFIAHPKRYVSGSGRALPEPAMIGKLDEYMRFNEVALGLRSQRQSVLASNIANADTPEYKARDIDFANALQGAMN